MSSTKLSLDQDSDNYFVAIKQQQSTYYVSRNDTLKKELKIVTPKLNPDQG
jgi:hypothetical protein